MNLKISRLTIDSKKRLFLVGIMLLFCSGLKLMAQDKRAYTLACKCASEREAALCDSAIYIVEKTDPTLRTDYDHLILSTALYNIFIIEEDMYLAKVRLLVPDREWTVGRGYQMLKDYERNFLRDKMRRAIAELAMLHKADKAHQSMRHELEDRLEEISYH
jgi:hypothetical protein